nr:uncharacterized protein LOC109158421 [Ipomoea batatas]
MPMKSNLILRRVDILPECVVCGDGIEHTLHALCTCINAKEVWRQSGFHVAAMSHDNVAVQTASSLVSSIGYVPNGRTCCFDIGLSPELGVVSFGACFFQEGGGFDAATNNPLVCTDYPLLAEAMVCKEALSWVKAKGWMDVCMESDCFNLVNALNSKTLDRSYFGSVVYSCKLLSNLFDSCAFLYISRTANQPAHVLAKAVDSRSCQMYWEDSSRNSILDFF